jgi:hypothetical protein
MSDEEKRKKKKEFAVRIHISQKLEAGSVTDT